HKHDIEPNVIEAEGNVSEAILKEALQLPCDLIVIGTHGTSGYRDGFIGTNAYNIIKYASCPVLTIPPKRKIVVFKKLLFPIRPITGALMQFDTVANFLAANATIDVVGLSYHTIEGETNLLDKIVEEIRMQLKKSGASTQTFWGSIASIPEAVLQHAQQANSDLIVITSLLDNMTKSNYIGPHAQRIIHQSKVPVLIIKKMGVPAFA
ncbi:MAG: universal stress protein, partial [Bacteroidota bacterium]|nr:universal stress protein [Bacteroidota bacterium]